MKSAVMDENTIEEVMKAYSGFSITPDDLFEQALNMARDDDQFLGFILGFVAGKNHEAGHEHP